MLSYILITFAYSYAIKAGQILYSRLEKSGILYDYIIPSYDVLHTFSERYLMLDLAEYMKEKGVLSDICLEDILEE